jgi:hypothetical protein
VGENSPFRALADQFLVQVFAATPPYDGTLARYYQTPGHITYKLPDHLTLEDGALVCAYILLRRSATGIDPGYRLDRTTLRRRPFSRHHRTAQDRPIYRYLGGWARWSPVHGCREGSRCFEDCRC